MVVLISLGLRKFWVMVALEFGCNYAQSKTLLHLPLKQVIRYWNKSRHNAELDCLVPYLLQNYLNVRRTT